MAIVALAIVSLAPVPQIFYLHQIQTIAIVVPVLAVAVADIKMGIS